jgi:heme exporter protein B
VVSSFAFRKVGYGTPELNGMLPGIFWLCFLFAGVTVLNRALSIEREDHALIGLLLTRVDPLRVYFSKATVIFGVLWVVQLLLALLLGLFFSPTVFSVFPELLLLSALAAVGFSALGTLLATIATATQGREIVLPLLLFPLLLPLFAGAVFLTQGLLDQGVVLYSSFWFVLLVAFDVVALALSIILFEFAVLD